MEYIKLNTRLAQNGGALFVSMRETDNKKHSCTSWRDHREEEAAHVEMAIGEKVKYFSFYEYV